MPPKADIVICGAGIAGVSAAYFLAKAGVGNILLLDERSPLSLTSDHSTECYRNWWPDPAILGLMNHSIDLMEELAEQTGNAFHMNRRGYLYLTADPKKIAGMKNRAARISGLGGGQLRIHQSAISDYLPSPAAGFRNQPTGADLLLDPALIRKHFPYLTEKVIAALHVRRAGWLSAQQLGMTLLTGARKLGVTFETGRISGVETDGSKVRAVRLADGRRIPTANFVNAAGPMFKEVGAMLGLDLPIITELHLKAAIKDKLRAVGRNAPLLIWEDRQQLAWTEAERNFLREDDLSWMLG
ncbi:MAG: FAD-binding oxidoreductase, partial [Anaerolineales bacterium]|nr:FAD-binding oxidoreductase [Anaerolineales bacterium]